MTTDGISLVIGGAGCVGRHVVAVLLQRGHQVRVFDREACTVPQVESIMGDIRDPSAVAQACRGVTTVFQTASIIDVRPGSDRLLRAVNIDGNRHVIAACHASGVRRLIYTSSIDVVFDGRPIRAGDEMLPYAARHLDTYGRTKMLAERDVLQANGQGQLSTCALRLAGVYGPGDRHRFPPILQLARANRGMRLGDGSARFNHVYVENVAHAQLCAAERLAPGSPLAGSCYFITDHAPRNFFSFFDPFLRALGLPVPTRTIPYRVAYLLAYLWEAITPLAGKRIRSLAPLTRYAVASTCVDFFFSGERAARELGYAPPVDEQEALRRTVAWFRGHPFDAA
ncbi:MAG TPA: NAD-dependent epimerase/dehydratase family protein [Roseiflexaceae bacterium]|nr:NAD-dependent epimerase/dehydratase family protein [Roseiflexaceae bacterium]HMP42730.1 NAD-dependent epimerase/dehydratase family protein [Roseiflexaceae bacterium]